MLISFLLPVRSATRILASNALLIFAFTEVFLFEERRALLAVGVTGMSFTSFRVYPNRAKIAIIMVSKVFYRGKNFLTGPQNSILSAAMVIMVMVVFSAILGLVRQRLFLHFFEPEKLALFFAAFRIPDLVFQLLAYGMFSSAFIPVFTKTHKNDPKRAFEVSNRVISIGLTIFVAFAILFALLADPIYSIIAPGYAGPERVEIVNLARVLLLAQAVFVISYVLTGILESLRRFVVPALAPIFYNVGIITVTILFSNQLGLMAPAIGAVFGALLHLAIQIPAARSVGVKFKFNLHPNEEVRKIGKLALPRVLELGFLESSKMADLFLTSIIASAALTYYSLADAVRIMPINLFGISLAKAALPTLSSESDEPDKFRKSFLSTWYQIMFLVLPVAAILIALRIPVVRLLFGTDRFDWESTVQTGLIVSAFALTIPFQSSVALLSRAFYALHDTKTPVKISMIGVTISITLEFIFVLIFKLPTWSLALAYAVGSLFQSATLYYILSKRLNGGTLFAITPVLKSLFAAVVSGSAMFFFIKFFDRSVWVKRLSFLGNLKAIETLDFEKFVIDTRYTGNLLALTIITALLGGLIYLAIQFLLGSNELKAFFEIIRRKKLSPPPKKETETLSPAP